MKLGDIKLESLRLMNANDENLSFDNLSNYEKYDDRFKDYLDKMPGAINRAISRMMVYRVIPTKVADIKPSQGESLKEYLKLNLKKLIPDFESLERVIYIYERVMPNIDYQTIVDGEIMIPYRSSYIFKGVANAFPTKAKGGEAYNVNGICKFWDGNEWVQVEEDELFKIEYTPKAPYITSTTDNNSELNIPEVLARVIPYFIKAELYEGEEPQISASARNIFESALSEYVAMGQVQKNSQQYVKNEFF